MNSQILRNKIQCNKCGETIESQNTHDYVQCKCGNCAAAGGRSYLRRTGEDYRELSTIELSVEQSAKVMKLLNSYRCLLESLPNEESITIGERQNITIEELWTELNQFLDGK